MMYGCDQGTAEKLVQHLILHNSAADPTYVDDFLLTYRTFLKSTADITSQLLTWFDDQTHSDKVIHNSFFSYFLIIFSISGKDFNFFYTWKPTL